VASIILREIVKRYGAVVALDRVSLSIESGEFVTLLGPSGCGKSTTLRAVAGLASIEGGHIVIDGADVTAVPTARRNIGMVFQNLALFPHMTVLDNLSFGLRMRGVSSGQRRDLSERAMRLVHLDGLADRYPAQLSGGQQQRVAIARALVINPRVLLLDEPFAALDRQLRDEMQVELRALTRQIGITTLFVTHDQQEALTLSDRIALMNRGRIEQFATPTELYHLPLTPFAADFMGVGNILDIKVRDDGSCVMLSWHGIPLMTGSARHGPRDGHPQIGVRPEHIELTPPGTPGAITAKVRAVRFQGAFTHVELCPANLPETPLIAHVPGAAAATIDLAVGTEIGFRIPPEAIILLTPDNGRDDTGTT
jgi:ABC-type Fe3+/spermidine/putrescine transport system ATPase subunit